MFSMDLSSLSDLSPSFPFLSSLHHSKLKKTLKPLGVLKNPQGTFSVCCCAVEIMGDAISLCTGLNDTKDEKFEKKVSVNAFLHLSSLPSPHRSIDPK
jgi:hypothetical protein